MASRHLPGRIDGRAILLALCCAACSPGGGAREGADKAMLGEEQAISRAAEMLDTRPPATGQAPPAPPAR